MPLLTSTKLVVDKLENTEGFEVTQRVYFDIDEVLRAGKMPPATAAEDSLVEAIADQLSTVITTNNPGLDNSLFIDALILRKKCVSLNLLLGVYP
jgi:hypothetical protein